MLFFHPAIFYYLAGLVKLLGLQSTDTEFFDQFPGWSPDGKSLVFDSSGQYGKSVETIAGQLYIMQFTDRSIRRLITDTSLSTWSSSWSPDGKWIAFSGKAHGNQNAFDIYKINIETLEIVNLTNTPDDSESDPSWSPDGANIAFDSASRAANWSDNYIYLMDSDGKNPRHLLSDKSLVYLGGPEWSPKGDKIVYTCGPRYDVCIINRDGSKIERLTDAENIMGGYTPSWSPDGSRIAFISKRDGFENIYIMNEDGSNVVRITDGSLYSYSNPVWQP